jgi:hypothetical protein
MTKANYPKLIVEPIQFQLIPEVAKSFTEEEKLKIQEYTRKARKKIISAHYQIVNEPGSDVGRLRMAFTDIEKSNALLALYPATRVAGVGRGAPPSRVKSSTRKPAHSSRRGPGKDRDRFCTVVA